MGSVVPLKKYANSAYLDLKNLVRGKLEKVEHLINLRLESKVELIQKMTSHHLESGGKRLRALLTLGSAKLAGYDLGERDVNLAGCVELIHSATLLHDDVIDESVLRRGKKTTNTIWGNQSSILNGDLEILKLLSSTSAKIAQGEVLQLQHKGEADLLEETYIKIINLKTAALFSAATETGACLAKLEDKKKEALASYGKNLGLAFQIADDALDYFAKEIMFGKEIGKDFYEGKTTLPLIIIFQRANKEEKEFLKEILKKEKRNEDDFSEVLALINKYKAVEKSLERAEYFVNVSRDALAIFPESKDKNILQSLSNFSLNRSY
jgi:octaprenyl-diphosphate synthase